MNKRQAKKQFKKKYGMNPNDYYLICNMDAIVENVRKLCDECFAELKGENKNETNH